MRTEAEYWERMYRMALFMAEKMTETAAQLADSGAVRKQIIEDYEKELANAMEIIHSLEYEIADKDKEIAMLRRDVARHGYGRDNW